MIIKALAYRKQHSISCVVIPEGTISIGDAAFSLCPRLNQVTIPASVEYIGVAAFCSSGLEEVVFLGVPECIEPSAFSHCDNLKRIVVPKGKKDEFADKLPSFKQLIIEEAQEPQKPTDLFGSPIVKRSRLVYNLHDFSWAIGDKVLLSELFSGPTALIGNPSYQFRKKGLFVFMESKTASAIVRANEYSVPANTAHFNRKYQEKYGSRKARIFLFVCDDGENATFFDEVRLKHLGNNSIIVTSNL